MQAITGRSDISLLRNETFADIWRETVQLHAGKVAARFLGRSETYSSLDELSNRIANSLTTQGIGSGSRIAVCIGRSIELHATILGILKSGAAYVPIDSETPAARIYSIIEESGAQFILVDETVEQKLIDLALRAKVQNVSNLLTTHAAADALNAALRTPSAGPQPSDTAYIIFTSGSTGKPKGIAVSHRNVCHLIRSENSLLGIQSSDVVWQGFSCAFDMWIEESLITYSVGATLEIACKEDMHSIDLIAARMINAGVTILHIVPTLAAAISEEIPALRIVNFGGEACPAVLAKRWLRPTRKVYNSYGPTETTVSATFAELSNDRAITIGRPLPNYSGYVVNERLELVARGERGELLLGGPGVSLGYVNRSDLNTIKFIPNPWLLEGGIDPTLYRSGDNVSVNADGEIEFHGRIDTQVKIRGYRVELEEIESVIAEQPGISSAAVKIESDAQGIEHLVAFFVTDAKVKDGNSMNYLTTSAPDSASLRKSLQSRLPSYMMPTEIRKLDAMPTLTSGKVDRNSLPKILGSKEPGLVLVTEIRATHPPRTATEKIVVAAMSKTFGGMPINVDADCFMDLGGHSLLVAALVSELRKHPKFEGISFSDIYTYPTAETLARYVDSRSLAEASSPADAMKAERIRESQRHVASTLSYVLCSVGQVFGLVVIFSILALQFLVPFLTYLTFSERTASATLSALATVLVAILLPVLLSTTVVTLKWLVIGRVREGDYPIYGQYYLRFWFVQRLKDSIPTFLISGTPFYASFLRTLGARIGKDVDLGGVTVDAEDLLEINDHASISATALLDNAKIENGWLKLRKITIGRHAFVGTGAVVAGGTELGSWSELGDLAATIVDQKIPQLELWRGSPAVHQGQVNIAAILPARNRTTLQRTCIKAIYLGLFAGLAALTAAPVLPIIMLLRWLEQIGVSIFASSLFLAALYVFLFAGEVWAVRWLVLGRLPAGIYAVDSIGYMRKWFIDQLSQISLTILHPAYATLYMPFWFRAMGAKIGKRSEISTASSVTYHLLEVGDEAFVADNAVLGDSQIRNGWLELKPTRIGQRSFIGNSAVVSDGTNWPDGSLLGVLSVAPPVGIEVPKNSTWLGVPATMLPRRECFADVENTLTYTPKIGQIAGRLSVETARILIPYAMIFILANLLVTAILGLGSTIGFAQTALLTPVLFVGIISLPAFLVTAILKWLCVGSYKPGKWAMWTRHVWLSEAITSTYEASAVPLLLNPLRGTPFLAVFLRILGVKIGRRVILDTTDFTEFDMVEIGDEAVLEDDCGAQTHLFEDRVMKVDLVKLGSQTSIGARSVILYGAELEDDVTLAAMTLVMKGERLPENTAWRGVPAVSYRGNAFKNFGNSPSSRQAAEWLKTFRQNRLAKTDLAPNSGFSTPETESATP